MPTADREAIMKIRDPKVRGLALDGSDVSVDVLIQLNVETPTLVMSRDSVSTMGRPVGFKIHPEGNRKQEFEEFGRLLRAKGLTEPVALEMANAYATTLPASALVDLVRNPLVRSIDTNKRSLTKAHYF